MSYQNTARDIANIFEFSHKIPFGTSGTNGLLPLVDDTVLSFGDGTVSFDLKVFGSAAANYLLWDASANDLIFQDNVSIMFGTGSDIEIRWDGTDLDILQATVNSAINLGVDGAGIDLVLNGDTASANLTWDQSADRLIVNGVAAVQGLRTASSSAAAITIARVLTLADAGGTFSVSQAGAYDIDLPSPTTGPGCRYNFYLTAAGANNVTITVTGAAATFVGTIVNDVTSVLPATGATLTFASGASALGDNIEIVSISTTLYLVRAVSSAAGGITIA